jgi:adenosine kinase
MSEDSENDIAALCAAGGIELVLIGAGDPVAMQRYTSDCRAAGIPFASDFSQQVAFLDGAAMRTLIEGAVYLFCNEYEASAIQSKTGWSASDILARVQTWVITLGSEGARVERQGEPPVAVGPVPDATLVEPTGAGDAFRCGFLAATAWGLPLERAIQLGNLMAVHALETVGPQEYDLSPRPDGPPPRVALASSPLGANRSPSGLSAFLTSNPFIGNGPVVPARN